MHKSLTTLSFLFLLFTGNSQQQVDSIAFAIGNALEESFYANETDLLLKYWENDVFVERILMDDASLMDESRSEEIDATAESVLLGFIQKIFSMTDDGSYYNFINFYEVEFGVFSLIFRHFGEGGMGYHEYLLQLPLNAEPYLSDIFIYTSGELLSDIIRPFFLSEFSKNPNEVNQITQHYLTLAQIRNLIDNKKLKEARELYNSAIPAEAKSGKIFKLLELQMVDTNDEEQYAAFLENFLGNSENEAFQYLLSIDLFIMNEDYDNALNSVEGLYDFTGDDLLDLYRANLWAGKGNLDSTFHYLDAVEMNFPHLPEIYDLQISYLYDLEDWSAIRNVLDRMWTNLELDFDILQESVVSDMPELAASSAYRSWRDSISPLLQTFEPITQDEYLDPYQNELNQKYRNPSTSPLKPEDLVKFEGHDFFPLDSQFVVEAAFTKSETLSHIELETSLNQKIKFQEYGVASFTIQGQELELTVYLPSVLARRYEGREYLFIPFYDLTNGDQTYGGGRYVECDIPEGKILNIDFNHAYNPYCAYNDKYSCPIPPKSNMLNVNVTAGVKNFVKK